MNPEKRKRALTGWEKAAITIIIILVLAILALIFEEKIESYVKIFMDWYQSSG